MTKPTTPDSESSPPPFTNIANMGTPVKLYIYDLTQGVASIMSAQFLGRQIDGIWHTSVVVYEREYFYGSQGIQRCSAGGTVLGEPKEKINLGETHVPFAVFQEYLQGLSETTFQGSSYNLLKHNCNHFSDELAQFLCGSRVPKHILDLPDTVLETPFGQIIRPLLEGLSQGPALAITNSQREESPEFQQLQSAIEEARTIPSRDQTPPRKTERSKMAESEPVATNGETNGEDSGECQVTKKARDVVAEIEAEERRELEELRKKQRDPPITFKDLLDVRVEFDALVGLVDGKLNPEEQQSLEELHQYMLEDEGSWALGEGFLNFVGRLLHDKSLSADTRVRTLNVLALAALKDDVILLLHQDRREHVLMNYAGDVERVTPEEQKALAIFFANLFENLSSSEWLLYISEWQHNNSTLSNIRVTTKVAVNALLADNSALQDAGSAIIHNMACKEVFDDVAVELTMALLQYLNSNPGEEQLFRVLKSLARFCQISGQDVPQLIQMIGPEPVKFKGASPRIDEQITLISQKLR